MKILVIGSGGREHALAWKLAQSTQCREVFVAPGNAGTGKDFRNVDLDPMDFEAVKNFCLQEEIDLVVVGPEDPLAAGLVDSLQAAGIKVFGPKQDCAQFEASKDFTKRFLVKYDIPTAEAVTVTDFEAGLAYLQDQTYPVVLKADGLCKGKGVIIAQDFDQAQAALARLLQEPGHQVVIEDFLDGEESSLLCFVSHNRLIPMETARDYKKAFDGDQGPNTGGVGVYSPGSTATPEEQASVAAILEKIEEGLEAEGFDFTGILFIGLMFQAGQAKVLEFNVRFGDPETQALMPRLSSDLLVLIEKCLAGTLQASDLVWRPEKSLGLVLYSKGYPGAFQAGTPIQAIPTDLPDNVILFHNGTKLDENGSLLAQGGRVLTLVALSKTIKKARNLVYQTVNQIEATSLTYRRDIGLDTDEENAHVN